MKYKLNCLCGKRTKELNVSGWRPVGKKRFKSKFRCPNCLDFVKAEKVN